jgi:Restriction Endonuclease associating with ARP
MFDAWPDPLPRDALPTAGLHARLTDACHDLPSPESSARDVAALTASVLRRRRAISGLAVRLRAPSGDPWPTEEVWRERWRNARRDLSRLTLGSLSRFEKLELERACHSGLRGTPPHLDALASGPDGIVAVESKCTEFLSEHRAAFRDVYRKRFDELAHPTWRHRFETLSENPGAYRFLDAAQLLEHYLGLKNTFPGEENVVLLYVWWEPSNAEALPIFAEHRSEVRAFSKSLSDPQIRFQAEPYPELWSRWKRETEPDWLHEHVDSLCRRYLVHVDI